MSTRTERLRWWDAWLDYRDGFAAQPPEPLPKPVPPPPPLQPDPLLELGAEWHGI